VNKSDDIVKSIREATANLIAQGQSQADAERNAISAHFFLSPDDRISRADSEGLSSNAQALIGQATGFEYADGPETESMKLERQRQGILTDAEAKEWEAKIEQQYAHKALLKQAQSARNAQQAAIDDAISRGTNEADAKAQFGNLDLFLPRPKDSAERDAREAKIKALEASAKPDYGFGDALTGGEAATE
jgi:hypothetical protein